MIRLGLQLDQRFRRKLVGRYERFSFEVGVLKDKAYRAPAPKRAGFGTLAGGPVRKQSKRRRGKVSDVSEALRKQVDFYHKPFRRESRELRAFIRAYTQLAAGVVRGYGRVEAALRAVVRVPLAKQQYGKNTRATARSKGFNRFGIMTGQLYRAIMARVRSNRGV